MSTQRPRRDRITPALIAVTIVLAIGVGIIVYLAETKDDGQRSGAGRADGQPAGAVLPSAPTSPTSPAITPSPGRTSYRCWDGTDATSLTHCTDPTGEAAIGWIFPDEPAAARFGTCHSKSGAERAVFVQCDLSWHGHVVHLHVSAWTDWHRARGHYDGGGAVRQATTRADGSMLIQWQPRRSATPFADAPWKVAEMVSGRPWTLAAYADDPVTAQQALAAFGRIRDVRQWRGVER